MKKIDMILMNSKNFILQNMLKIKMRIYIIKFVICIMV